MHQLLWDRGKKPSKKEINCFWNMAQFGEGSCELTVPCTVSAHSEWPGWLSAGACRAFTRFGPRSSEVGEHLGRAALSAPLTPQGAGPGAELVPGGLCLEHPTRGDRSRGAVLPGLWDGCCGMGAVGCSFPGSRKQGKIKPRLSQDISMEIASRSVIAT